MAKQQSSLLERTKVSVKEPPAFNFVMHNDDLTTSEFVVEVLNTVFFKTYRASQKLMLQVHEEGKAIVGTYSYDIAVSKVELATGMARAAHFPLKLTVEEA